MKLLPLKNTNKNILFLLVLIFTSEVFSKDHFIIIDKAYRSYSAQAHKSNQYIGYFGELNLKRHMKKALVCFQQLATNQVKNEVGHSGSSGLIYILGRDKSNDRLYKIELQSMSVVSRRMPAKNRKSYKILSNKNDFYVISKKDETLIFDDHLKKSSRFLTASVKNASIFYELEFSKVKKSDNDFLRSLSFWIISLIDNIPNDFEESFGSDDTKTHQQRGIRATLQECKGLLKPFGKKISEKLQF